MMLYKPIPLLNISLTLLRRLLCYIHFPRKLCARRQTSAKHQGVEKWYQILKKAFGEDKAMSLHLYHRIMSAIVG